MKQVLMDETDLTSVPNTSKLRKALKNEFFKALKQVPKDATHIVFKWKVSAGYEKKV